MKAKHYIAMAGIHGCIPNYCQSHETRKNAVDDLADMHEISQRRRSELRKFGYLELRKNEGNEYFEITECDCSNPETHNDN